MREVHPAFDPATSTWFVGTKEARTIRELLVKLGGPDNVCAIGYKPMGAAAPLIVREPHDTSVLGKALKAAIRSSLDDTDDRVELARPSQRINPKHVAKRQAERSIPAPPALPNNLAPRPAAVAPLRPVHKPRPTIDKTFGVGVGFPMREATAQERDQWMEIENAVLDMWAEGKNGPDIAKALYVKVQFVSSNVVWKARIAGDPRAVVRLPNAIGKRHNRPKHNGHTSSRNRNYARIVERARNADGGTDKASS